MKNILKESKLTLVIYSIITAICFTCLVMPENSGIGPVIFVIIQFSFARFFIPGKKTIITFLPIFIMSLNSFISANEIWKLTNLIICLALFACISQEFNFKVDTTVYLEDITRKILSPFNYFKLPFEWAFKIGTTKTTVLKRIAMALVLALPCAIFLTLILANADMVFSLKAEAFIKNIFSKINLHTVFIIICGIITGLYAFGVIYSTYNRDDKIKNIKPMECSGDLIIINILLTVLLTIYTAFVVIQFKYLFAGTQLPNNLTYTEYARKGFFELLLLTVINIIGILASVQFTKQSRGIWAIVTKFLCHYMCSITMILLISSFYRMWLYTNDDGLTRLRTFVMLFLVFETIGLIVTYFYIAKPQFNITLIYLCISLAYYLFLNLLPTDTIIAQNQINKYLNGERESIDYVFTLSADASKPLEYLYRNTNDLALKERIKNFLINNTNSQIPSRWQRYNLSVESAKNSLENLK